MLLVLAQMASAKTELVSNDPNWLGGRATFNTTEGNDFWLTFMNNNTFDPDAPDNKSIKFEMQIAISASETMDVVIAIGNSTKTVTVPANETYIYELDRDDASQIYLLTSEKDGYQGVHHQGDPGQQRVPQLRRHRVQGNRYRNQNSPERC